MADQLPTATTKAVGHYDRLQEIEERVVRAIEAAGLAMGELAKEREHIDKQLLNMAVKGFLDQLQEAQTFVLEAIQSAAPDRDFEANNYFLMLQAMAAAEKLDAVSVHISGISKVLREQQQQQLGGQAPTAPSPEAASMDMQDGAALEAGPATS